MRERWGEEGDWATTILPVVVSGYVYHEGRQHAHWSPSGCMSGIFPISLLLGTLHPHVDEQYWMTVKVFGSYLRTDE